MLVVTGGITLLFVILSIWAGYRLARSRGHEALPWAIVCGLLPGIGLLVLLTQRRSSEDVAAGERPAVGEAEQAQAVPLRPSHEERWRWLMLNDPDIMSAVERLRPFGPSAQLVLRDIYLPAENKHQLNQMVAQVANQAYQAAATVRNQQRKDAVPPAQAAGSFERSTDLASYTMKTSGTADASQSPISQPPPVQIAQPIVPPQSFTPPAGPSFVNGQETGPLGVGNAQQAPPSNASANAAARRPERGDTLASATAALATALREARIAPEPDDDPPPPPRNVPHHTSVVASDLNGASFLETYRGIHLFALADGRVYVDKYLAVGSLDLARQAVDYVAMRNDSQ